MLRLNKLTDYAIVILGQMAREAHTCQSAAALSGATGVPEPTVSKILKDLGKGGLVSSSRGAQGGYRLCRDGSQITVRAVIEAIEGPIALTDCVDGVSSCCAAQKSCPSNGRWDKVNAAVTTALDAVTLLDMMRPLEASSRFVQLHSATTR